MGAASSIARAIVNIFPPLRTVRWILSIKDCICYILERICLFLFYLIRQTFRFLLDLVKKLCDTLNRLISYLPCFKQATDYERLKLKTSQPKLHEEPIPYRDQPIKRALTYYGGLVLGSLLYLFVYYVLVKHHTFTSVSVALLLMLAYLIVLENSHSIRSILMLSLPIMFTNRGRALVFCLMLTMMVSGPINNTQWNIKELHMSLTCCEKYLVLKSDQFVEKNVVQNVIRVEDIVRELVDNIRKFASELRDRLKLLAQLAITVSRYCSFALEELRKIVDVCNTHTNEAFRNCILTFDYAYKDCKSKLGSGFDVICEVVPPLKELCQTVRLPDLLCEIPKALVEMVYLPIEARLKPVIKTIENEFYVDIDISHKYSYNETKTKPYKQVYDEIRYDIAQRFWYINLVRLMFNFVTLVLVIFILTTATLYHMHYLTEVNYDNMYLESFLERIDKFRRRKMELADTEDDLSSSNLIIKIPDSELLEKARDWIDDDKSSLAEDDKLPKEQEEEEEENGSNQEDIKRRRLLLPMTSYHKEQYLKPFSISMNDAEQQKLLIASFVWIVICGYVWFFVLVDFGLFELIELINSVLNDILFTSDLPLIDVTSKSGYGQVVRFNRTYLNLLKKSRQNASLTLSTLNSGSIQYKKGSIGLLYRRLMDSIEKKLPDDVDILNSLEQCLPKANKPDYYLYKTLLYLTIFTFGAVILEAYMLRTRHCIANLYYPIQAKKRAVWFYRKLLSEKSKYEDSQRLIDGENKKKNRALDLFEKGLTKVVERKYAK